jgi:hypothetical protein
MGKSLSQIRAGDFLKFAGMWHLVVNVICGHQYGMLYFKTYPPVVVRTGDMLEAREAR